MAVVIAMNDSVRVNVSGRVYIGGNGSVLVMIWS